MSAYSHSVSGEHRIHAAYEARMECGVYQPASEQRSSEQRGTGTKMSQALQTLAGELKGFAVCDTSARTTYREGTAEFDMVAERRERERLGGKAVLLG